MKETPKRALVLVHGFLGASNNWLGVVAKLRARPELANWEVVCPDLRWHSGDSHRFASLRSNEVPPSTSAVAVDLAAQLAQVSAEELLLVGHSFGLRPLVKILADRLLPSKRILALVAEDSSPELSDHGTQVLEKVLKDTPVPFLNRESARHFFDDNFGASSPLSRFLLSNIREDSERGGHTWRFPHETLIELLNHSVSESLQEQWTHLEMPVFMIVGDHSEHLSHAQAEYWRGLRLQSGRKVDLRYVEGAGHWVHSEQPDGFVEALANVVKVVTLAT